MQPRACLAMVSKSERSEDDDKHTLNLVIKATVNGNKYVQEEERIEELIEKDGARNSLDQEGYQNLNNK